MLLTYRNVFSLVLLGLSLAGAQAAAREIRLVPQVARGIQGDYIESAIVVVNPQPDPVTLHLDSFGIDVPESSIELQAGEAREVRFTGTEFQVGWVALQSEDTLSATAHILTRENGPSGRLVSQLSILAQPVSSRFVMPVFVDAAHLDDTGVALAIATSGRLRLTLRDESGETAAVRNFTVSNDDSDDQVDITGHYAAFLSEIFDLPPAFNRGSLTIDQILPEGFPEGFSAVAIYSGATGFHASPSLAVDLPGTYSLTLSDTSDSEQVIIDLANQYGFAIDGLLGEADVFAVTMPRGLTPVVARDLRVQLLEPAEEPGTRWRFEFEDGMEDWSVGFADLPENFNPEIYELDFEHRELPGYLGSEKGILVQGHNRSDDLFMFAKRRIEGLKPNTTYNVRFDVEIATQAPRDAVGIGGAPGESVWVKAGASRIEPETVIDSSGWIRLNIDKGNQSQEGEDATILGNIAKMSGVFSDRFELKRLRNSTRPFVVETDDSGSLWLLIGTDSGFEGKTVLIYNRISVAFHEQ